MASLTDVYEGHLRTVTTSRRFYAGASCFAVGAAMVVGSIAVATTSVGGAIGLERIAARRLAGALAGVGLAASVLGVFGVLPSGRSTRAAAVIGASVSGLGVALFWTAYPDRWFGAGDPLALLTVVVYFAGAMTTLSCLFVGLATFKTRNDPGGTARMHITEAGNLRLVEDAEPGPAFGSVGLFGRDPDGEVGTQTNRESPPGPRSRPDDGTDGAEILTDAGHSGRSGRSRRSGSQPGTAAPTADGGTATVDGSQGSEGGQFTDAEFVETAAERGRPDAYCGNCEHFEYVKVDEKITPYCGLRDELMEDMDACDEWVESS